MINVVLDHDVVQAGGFLGAKIHWSGDRPVRRIIAAAQWETDGEGNRVWGVGRSTVIDTRGFSGSAIYPVRLMIPHEGPVSFRGTLTAIVWKLRVQIDQPGFDEFGEAEFRVEPRKR
ncbi:MAG TPA: hypothetical protein VLV78_17975 [Thermoanaerobaculia bacterium]|nr:hypothetical protein [Thermoanaerobaculia bacterium]